MKRLINIKKKIQNHLMIHGEKKTCEKVFIESIKKMQKHSKKQTVCIVQLAIVFSTPIFKLHEIHDKKKKRNKKVLKIPSFIASKHARTSLSIKYVIKAAKIAKQNYLYNQLKDELLLNASCQSSATSFKNNIQKEVISKKRYFLYYRWG